MRWKGGRPPPGPKWVGFYSNARAVPTPAEFPPTRIVKGADHRVAPDGRQCRTASLPAIVLGRAALCLACCFSIIFSKPPVPCRSSAGGFGRRGIDPSDITIGTAIDDVNPSAGAMVEHHAGGAGQVQFHHRFGNRKALQGRRGLG